MAVRARTSDQAIDSGFAESTLGLDDLRYHDSYPPLVRNVSADYSWDNSKRLVPEALALLRPYPNETMGVEAMPMDDAAEVLKFRPQDRRVILCVDVVVPVENPGVRIVDHEPTLPARRLDLLAGPQLLLPLRVIMAHGGLLPLQ